jgi:hypothetical protein
MSIQRIATVVPVDDLPAAVTTWGALLGAPPTFVDGDRWAQFDVAGARLALAGTDRVSDRVGVMLKVDDLAQARAAAADAGLPVSAPQTGTHEVRCVAQTPDGTPIVLYAEL